MTTRTPEDVLAGVLRIAVGGVEKIVPTLPIRATREWQASLGSTGDSFSPKDVDDWTPADASDFSSLSLDVILGAVVAYDRTGALGGREWLEEHADPAQLFTAAQQMAEVAFPFAEDTRMFLVALVVQSVVGSSPPSSTNGPSPIGASRRRPSSRPSTRAS
jgi:hypothetical protein